MKQHRGDQGDTQGGSELRRETSSEGEKTSGCKVKDERKQEKRAVGVEVGGLCDTACALFSDSAVCHGPTVTN